VESVRIEKLDEGLFRLSVPFEDLTTTVYVAVTEAGVALIDSATYPRDVDKYILPALEQLGVARERVLLILLTHAHGDHAGGASRLAECLPNARVRASFETPLQKEVLLADGELLLGCLRVISLPGHTKNSVGYLDLRTNTLLSGDCLQLFGIGKYRNGIGLSEEYARSVERLRTMPIQRIVAAHEYDPLGSIAEGEAAVKRYLDECMRALDLALKNKKENIK